MNIDELKDSFKRRDRIVKVMETNGMFRAVAIKNTNTAMTAQSKHELEALPAFLLARQLSAASMMAAFLKGEERIVVEASGNGPVEKVFAEALQVGEVRGYIRMSETKSLDELKHFREAIGDGTLSVRRVLYNKSEPVQGVVEMLDGDLATDLAYYFTQSEQTPTAVLLDASVDNAGNINHSGGLLVQAMPGATNAAIEAVVHKLSGLKKISHYYAMGMSAEDLLKEALPFEFEINKTSPIDFYCRCSKDLFLGKLTTLGHEELEDMQKTGSTELVCQYCSSKYYIEDADFVKLITELKAKRN